MNIDDARVWFRYGSRMTVRVKANRSSAFRNCRHCNTDESESQKHLETYQGTKGVRRRLNMTNPREFLIFLEKRKR